MNSFIYNIPVKVYFGKDQLSNLGKELKKFGKRVLLTYGGGSIKTTGLYNRIIDEIQKADMELFELPGIEPNPRIETVRKGAKLCKDEKIDVLLAVGGGSTIDATKFISAGSGVDFDPWDFFTKGARVQKTIPIITVLTLAATGSEMNCGGVISNMKTNEKLATGAMSLLPKVSFLDPTVTYSVSRYQTACGAADILSHIFEVYFNMNKDLYMLDCFMEGLMKTVIKYAPIALKKPDDYEARANLMWASSWAINGFIDGGKSQAWSCHPMEHELSAFYDITHGLGLAILTPRWMKYCLDENTVDKFVQFGVNVFNLSPDLDKFETANRAIKKLSEFFFQTLELDSNLSKIGIDTKHFEVMSEKACSGKEIAGFKTLKPADVLAIYKMCLEDKNC